MELGMNNEDKMNTKVVIANLSMPDGKQYEIPLVSKTFSSGRQGFYAQIPSLVYNNEVYGTNTGLEKRG